jgi:hypothetical protein
MGGYPSPLPLTIMMAVHLNRWGRPLITMRIQSTPVILPRESVYHSAMRISRPSYSPVRVSTSCHADLTPVIQYADNRIIRPTHPPVLDLDLDLDPAIQAKTPTHLLGMKARMDPSA